MKFAAPLLASLVIVGQAQTTYEANLVSKDVFGNVLTQENISFSDGGNVRGMIDLSVSPHLKTIELTTSTYGVSECKIMLASNDHGESEETSSKITKIGMFHDVCDWPSISTVASGKNINMVAKMDISKVKQLKGQRTLMIDCMVDDISFATVSKDLDCLEELDTVQNAMITQEMFDFKKFFINEKRAIKQIIYLHISQFGKIFLGGANPFLDLTLDAVNLAVYDQTANYYFSVYGVNAMENAKHMLQSGKGKKGGNMAPKNYDGMVKGITFYGASTYGTQLVSSLY